MKYNLTKAEYKLLAMLIEESVLLDGKDNDSYFSGSNIRRVLIKKINTDKLRTLLNGLFCKGVLSSFTHDFDTKCIDFVLNEYFVESDLYKSIQIVNLDIVKSLRTDSGIQLYDYLKLNGKYNDGERTGRISIEDLRNIFGCKEGTYEYYKDLRVRKIDPAIKDLERAGCSAEYVPVKKGRNVVALDITMKDEDEPVSGELELDKNVERDEQYSIQMALGMVGGCLYNYGRELAMSPKDYQEYVLAFDSVQSINNFNSKYKPVDCVKVRVFRSDIDMMYSPLVVYAEVEDNKLVYKIRFENCGSIEYECTVNTPYEVVVALENIKQGILQGIDYSDIKLYDEKALHVPFEYDPQADCLFGVFLGCMSLIDIIDNVNHKLGNEFEYIYSVRWWCEDSLYRERTLRNVRTSTTMRIGYKDSLWSVQLCKKGFGVSLIKKDGRYYDSIDNKAYLKGITTNDYDFLADDLMGIFKIICCEDMDDKLLEALEDAIFMEALIKS